MHTFKKSSLMSSRSCDRGRFMTFRFDTICNITQVPHELKRYNYVCGFIGKSDDYK